MLRLSARSLRAGKLRTRCRHASTMVAADYAALGWNNSTKTGFETYHHHRPMHTLSYITHGATPQSLLKEGHSPVRIAAFNNGNWTMREKSTAVDVNEQHDTDINVRRRSGVRNVAIIAHVDHGKTTLVDQLLRACSSDQKDDEDRLLDCGDLEKERGITITSKVTRCNHRDTIVNIVDTPGQ